MFTKGGIILKLRHANWAFNPHPLCHALMPYVLVCKKTTRPLPLFFEKIYFIVRKLKFKKKSFACHCY